MKTIVFEPGIVIVIEIVEADDVMTQSQKSAAQMVADKSSRTGYQRRRHAFDLL